MDAQDRVRKSAQEATRPTAEQGLQDSSRACEEFAEPRGWALKWDGFALSGILDRSGARSTRPSIHWPGGG